MQASEPALDFRALLPGSALRDLVRDWLREDTPSYDVGGFVVGDKLETAHVYFKTTGVLSGVPFAQGRVY